MYEADCLEDDGVWHPGVDCGDFTCATTFNVPGDFDTIQEAINASGDGFEIIVGPGEYEALHTWSDSVIDLQGKALWLHSSGGSGKTSLDGQGKRRVINCPRADNGGEIRIEGFTVTGGSLAEGNGAGMRIGPFAEPVVTECVLFGNLTNGYGGAVFIDTNAAPLFEDCSFEYNSAHSGGAVHGSLCEATFTSCVFSTNYASVDGGAIVCNAQGEMTFHECSFLANNAIGNGGAVYVVAYSAVKITGSTINDNVAGDDSGALHGYIYSTISYGSSTFCGNYPADCVTFLGSSCHDQGGNEYCPPDDECPGDTNGDGVVGVLDLLAVIDQWGVCDDQCSADFNGDGTVGVTDLLVVLDAWGACE
jgi:predicted outer membrane repeat protein